MTTVYTIGHSNHETEAFVELLRQHGIELLIDVRSSPYSRYVPQANRETLARALQAAGIAYGWLGDRLGGKPGGIVADYDELRASPAFQQGIDSPDSPGSRAPHRHHVRRRRPPPVPSPQADHSCPPGAGVHVHHIQPDGSLVDEDKEPKQLSLF